ncbi:unnamed protein product [Rotaria sp. Silwood2]|nr:unnamed protein product [Rotaria sp. Silwood2]CAF2917896.1 unnamed protein product [Rotaria sp. Silwood2]CAF3060447.1 unnamed protein product [Rotaria sp. Silwood2]CAF4044984.1 unnamed protein product [Rotaria sp. Silwood2]CAF4054613.1 unnamed protein product [Rotaria sp. Silwood2]
MTQRSPSEQYLLHPIENHRNICQLTKNSITNITHVQNHTGTNTEEIQFNRDIGTNTPNYAEQIAQAIDYGNAAEEIAQMLTQALFNILAEATESYWKLMTERRRQATEETNIENQQLHTFIDDLSKENDKLRIVANHRDYLQSLLETLTADNDSLLDETNTDDSPID